jgi:hypothetical protein
MGRRGYILFSVMLIFLAFSLAIIYYLLGTNFYTNSSLFWIGGTAGVLVCAFLISTTLLLYLFITKAVSTRKFKLTITTLVLSALIFAIIFKFIGPFSLDSDIWWYGAIAGFLSCLSFVSLVLAFFAGYKLLKYRFK